MCIAIRFSRFEFSDKELSASGLDVSGDEVRVSFRSPHALLPVHYRGKNILMAWGNKNMMNKIPHTGYCKIESLQSGKWSWLQPEEAVVLASSALTNGVWYQVRQGIKALVVEMNGQSTCYILTQPSTHYFKIMTGSERMPALVNQIL